MNKFIDKNISIISENEEKAYNYLIQEKNLMKKIHDIIYDFIKQKDLVLEKPGKYANFNPVIIYSNNLIVNAFKLTNELAKNFKYISMATEIPYKLIHIKYARKTVATLNKHIMIKNNPCLKTCSLYHFDHEKGFSYIPVEYYMINEYQKYYNDEIDSEVVNKEKEQSRLIIKKLNYYIDLFSKKINNYSSDDINKVKDNFNNDYKDKNYAELQNKLLSLIKKKYLIYGRTLLKIKDKVPHLLYLYFIGDKNTSKEVFNSFKSSGTILSSQVEFILLKDNLLRTLWIINKKDSKYISFFSNSLDYEIIPYKSEKGYRIAHPYVSKRLMLIEIPFLLYNYYMNNLTILYGSRTSLMQIKQVFELLQNEDLSKYNNYMGQYKDPTIFIKLEQNKVRKENPGIVAPYDPLMYKALRGEFKEVKDTKDVTCNN